MPSGTPFSVSYFITNKDGSPVSKTGNEKIDFTITTSEGRLLSKQDQEMKSVFLTSKINGIHNFCFGIPENTKKEYV